MNLFLGALFNTIGFLVGIGLYWYEARRLKIATEGMTRILIIGAICGILVARIIERLAEGAPMTTLFDPVNGGRTIIGGVIGGWLFVEIAKRRMGIRRSTGPMWALALPAGEFFGRIGCWFNGCCFGKPTSLPWAIWQHDAMRHPTQFYLAGSAAAIFGVVWFSRDRVPAFPLYLVLWAGTRFVIEFFRQPITPTNGLTLAQWACLSTLATGAYGLISARRMAAA